MTSKVIKRELKKKGYTVVSVKYNRGNSVCSPSYLIQLAEGEGAYIKEKDDDYFLHNDWEDNQYEVDAYDLDELLECISPKGATQC